MSANQTTADNTNPSQPAAQAVQPTSKAGNKIDGILNKAGGLGNIIHGTGEIIHGHLPGAGDPARGGKAAIKAAGRQEVERGLDRIEGKPTANTSVPGHASARDGERSGVSDTGVTPTSAPQASTATPRADPTSQKAQAATADIRHPVDTDMGAAANTTAGTGTAAATGARGYGPALGQRHDERTQIGATTDQPIAANSLGTFQRASASGIDIGVRQQGNGMVAGDQDKLHRETAATALPSNRLQATAAADDPGAQTRTTAPDASDPANAAAVGGYDRPIGPSVPSDIDVRQQGRGFSKSDRDKVQETRTTVDTSDPVNTEVGQDPRHFEYGTAPQA